MKYSKRMFHARRVNAASVLSREAYKSDGKKALGFVQDFDIANCDLFAALP